MEIDRKQTLLPVKSTPPLAQLALQVALAVIAYCEILRKFLNLCVPQQCSHV